MPQTTNPVKKFTLTNQRLIHWARVGGRESAIDYLKSLPLSDLTGYQVGSIEADDACLQVIWVGDQPFFHTETQPSVFRGTVKYYLFDFSLLQSEWFSVMKMQEQDRLAHLIKWGKHD